MIDRVTLYEASKRLRISEGALRQPVHRGTLESEKGDDEGRVYVYLAPDDTQNTTGLLDELRGRIRFLEEELSDRKEESRRKDTLLARANRTLAQLASRVPELEAPPEATEAHPLHAPRHEDLKRTRFVCP